MFKHIFLQYKITNCPNPYNMAGYLYPIKCSWIFEYLIVSNSNFFVATASSRRRSHICRRNGWVMVTIEFRSLPNFDSMFLGVSLHLSRSTFALDTQFSVSFCDYWVIATSPLCYNPCSYCGYCLLYNRRRSHYFTGVDECVSGWW